MYRKRLQRISNIYHRSREVVETDRQTLLVAEAISNYASLVNSSYIFRAIPNALHYRGFINYEQISIKHNVTTVQPSSHKYFLRMHGF